MRKINFEITNDGVRIAVFEHNGDIIHVGYHPIGGYSAMINNEVPENFTTPIGVIAYVLYRLGII